MTSFYGVPDEGPIYRAIGKGDFEAFRVAGQDTKNRDWFLKFMLEDEPDYAMSTLVWGIFELTSSPSWEREIDSHDLNRIDPYFKFAQALASIQKAPTTDSVNLVISAHRKRNRVPRGIVVLFTHLFVKLGAQIDFKIDPPPSEHIDEDEFLKGLERGFVYDDGFSPIHHAASRGDPVIAEHLLSLGADINKKSSRGITPLMIASCRGDIPMLNFLLDKGADKALKMPDGRTAEDLARDAGVKELFRLRHRFESGPVSSIGSNFLSDGLLHRCANGLLVRSKAEVIIADCLFYNGLDFEYERPIDLGGKRLLPDFTIASPMLDKPILWEHLGLQSSDYRKRWQEKLSVYIANGFAIGTSLYVTEDINGTTDSHEVLNVVRRIKQFLSQ